MVLIRYLFLVWIIFCSRSIFSQDINYVKKIALELSAKKYEGRGYCCGNIKNTGIEKSRKFIESEIKKIGAFNLQEYAIELNKNSTIDFTKLKFKEGQSVQYINFDVNQIFMADMEINGKTQKLGIDFIPDPSCASVNGIFELIKSDSIRFVDMQNKVMLVLEDKIMFSVSHYADSEWKVIVVKKCTSLKQAEKIKVKLSIKSKVENVQSANVYAFIPGTQYPDSFIVLTAHYDHLGKINNIYFPGANDNASGVATLLNFMRYFSKLPQKYSVAFMFFTGEEAGLEGSKYYVLHPIFDLHRIKFLINFDLMGGGSDGIMVVNGKVFEKEFNKLIELNTANNFALTIKARGKSANSDHYYFSEKGVPSFFIYTMGDIKQYHNIFDIADDLKFTNYEKIFQLVAKFIVDLNQ